MPVDPALVQARTQPPAPVRAAASGAPGAVGGSPLARAAWGLVLGPAVGLVALAVGAPDPVLPAAILLSLVWTAWALFRAGGRTVWRFVLPLTVIVPPLALLTILVLAWRRRRAPASDTSG